MNFSHFATPWYGIVGHPLFLGFLALGIVAILWSIAWKAIGLWYAARDGKKGWFIAIFLLNTLGILEILYIYVFRKKNMIKDAEPVAPEETHTA